MPKTNKEPAMSNKVFAVILLAAAVFMYVSVWWKFS